MRPLAILLIALLAAPVLARPADLVIERARIWTDPGFAEFAGVRDGRFVYVGDRDESLIGPDTRRVDAGGRVVIPGMFDSHVHMLNGGRMLAAVNLRDAEDKADFVQRVADFNAELPEGAWLLGGRYSVESWEVVEQPTRAWIDPITRDRPAFLHRMDGHSGLANSAALRLAGIDASGPPDPEGGVIDRDPETNEPTGILRESAMFLVVHHIPEPSDEEKIFALRRAEHEALRHGVTSVADIPGIEDLSAYERFAEMGTGVRFYLYPTAPNWTRAVALADAFPGVPDRVQINGFKAYLDGSLGSRTALMREPYLGNRADKPDWSGIFLEGVKDGTFERHLTIAADGGYQAIVHAIGDEANHYLLDTLERAYGSGLAEARCRSEHAQHLLPEDIERFGALGVIASMQPYHKADDGRYAEDYIGAERCESSYTFRSLLDAGAVVAFGSDWPVVTINPWLGMEAAVTGRTLEGQAWQTQENLSVEEALRCYTRRAAYGVLADDRLGSIAQGFLADFVVLNTDIFGEDVDWERVRPVATYVGGEQVYP